MTTEELKNLFRAVADDPEQPGDGDDSDSLWADLEIYSYMHLAQRAFARETEIFIDSSTTAIVDAPVTADDPSLPMSPLIIKIKRARMASTKYKVVLLKHEEIDSGWINEDYGLSFSSNWQEQTGTPRILVTNWQKDEARLVPIPIANDTVNMTVIRYPLVDIVTKANALEVTEIEHQYIMLELMQHYAYKKHDADIFNEEKAELFRSSFMLKTREIQEELKKRYKPARVVEYGGL